MKEKIAPLFMSCRKHGAVLRNLRRRFGHLGPDLAEEIKTGPMGGFPIHRVQQLPGKYRVAVATTIHHRLFAPGGHHHNRTPRQDLFGR